MKKLLLFLTLLIAGFTANAQFSPSNNLNYIKLLKNPPIGTKSDSVMVFDGTDKFVKMIPTSSITTDISGKENISNKQNSLDNDGTGIKYPTVDATNAGLALKANINNPTFTGVLTNTNNIRSNNTNGVPSRFGGITSASVDGLDIFDTLSTSNTNFTSGDGHYRAILVTTEFSGLTSSNGTLTGISARGNTIASSTGNLTLTSQGGGIKGGRFIVFHRGSGEISKSSSVSAKTQNLGGNIINSSGFNVEPISIDLGKTATSNSAFLVEGGSVDGTLTNNHGLYINPLIAGTNRWGVYQAGSTDKNYFAGNTLFGTTTDNNQGVAQFNGNITISDGTLANHAVTKGQLDLKQNVLTNPITGTGTTNTLPKWTGTTTQGNSNFSDNGTLTSSSTDMTINGVRVGRGGGNVSGNLSFGGNNFASDIAGGNSTAIGTGALNIFKGYGNLAFGSDVLEYNINGSDNLGFAFRAGSLIANGDPNTNPSNSIFIGTFTKASADNQTNQIVIGNQSVGNGSNSTVLGNPSTAKTTIYGRFLQTLVDDGVNSAQFNGTVSGSPASLSNQFVTKSQLDLKADLASPTFTGVPSVPTAIVGTNTTQIASTAFVNQNSILLAGTQTISGFKTFNSGLFVDIQAGASGLTIQQRVGASNIGLNATNYNSGNTIYADKANATGDNIVANSQSDNTGFNFVGKSNGITNFTVSSMGFVTTPKITMNGTIKMMEYTVATLPIPTETAYATVTDALAPAYLVAVVGGGTVVTPVFYNGTTWVSH